MSAFCRDCFAAAQGSPDRCAACGSLRLAKHAELFDLSIAHVDCDAFYASVEKRDRPELRDRPVIVGGGVRGVVTTACYVARTYGVRSAMPMFRARRLCPDAVVLPPDFTRYREASARIFALVRETTPLVQTLSLDEAWLDLSGCTRLHGAPPAIVLGRLQRCIEAEIGVTVSIGLAPNRFLAKIASDLDKPRGFAVIGAAEARSFLAPRPVDLLPGVGPVFAEALRAAGLRMIGEIDAAPEGALIRRFGAAAGRRLARLAAGEDERPVSPDPARRTISAETTFNVDLVRREDLEQRLRPLCDRVARRARSAGLAGRVAILKLRGADFRIVTRRRKLETATQTAAALFAAARSMLVPEADGRSWRLIGAGLSDLTMASDEAGDLFGEGEAARRLAEEVEDGLRERYGPDVIFRARRLGKPAGEASRK